jgi:hypothetical protein
MNPKCPLCGQESSGKEVMGNWVCRNPDCPVEVFIATDEENERIREQKKEDDS